MRVADGLHRLVLASGALLLLVAATLPMDAFSQFAVAVPLLALMAYGRVGVDGEHA